MKDNPRELRQAKETEEFANLLRERLWLDDQTGQVRWRPGYGRSGAEACSVAGTVMSSGYVRIETDGVAIMAHRVGWLLSRGEWPPCDVDHKDLDKANSASGNLRLATLRENKFNSRVRADSLTGVKGVTLKLGRYVARIVGEDGKRIHLGYFSSAVEASCAYATAAKKIAGQFARIS